MDLYQLKGGASHAKSHVHMPQFARLLTAARSHKAACAKALGVQKTG